MKKTLIWDLPTRLFHWLLVPLFITSIVTVKQGYIEAHAISGSIMSGLLLFRIIWGFIGSDTAKFSYFLRPTQIGNYLRGKDQHLGHNPLGGLMVLGFLILIPTQILLGLFSNDAILFEGPLAHLVSSDLSEQATRLHIILAKIIFAMVFIHLLAILYYAIIKRQNLSLIFIRGWQYHANIAAKLPNFVPLKGAVLPIILCSVVSLLLFASL